MPFRNAMIIYLLLFLSWYMVKTVKTRHVFSFRHCWRHTNFFCFSFRNAFQWDFSRVTTDLHTIAENTAKAVSINFDDFLFNAYFADLDHRAVRHRRAVVIFVGSATAKVTHWTLFWHLAIAQGVSNMSIRRVFSNGSQHQRLMPVNYANFLLLCTPKLNRSMR